MAFEENWYTPCNLGLGQFYFHLCWNSLTMGGVLKGWVRRCSVSLGQALFYISWFCSVELGLERSRD